MSDSNGPAFQIDTEAFGLPTGINEGETPGAGFMYADDDLEIDENDPIYQATKAAWEREHGSTPPKPGEDERPPEMPTEAGDESDERESEDVDGASDETPPAAPPAADAGDDGAHDELGAADGTPPGAPDDDDDHQRAAELSFQVDGQDITLNAEQAEYLLRTHSWLDNLPVEVKQAWAGIEAGTHVAITAEEYQRLTSQQQQRTQKPTPAVPDIDELDDDVIEYIRSLEARVPANEGPATQDAPPSQQPDPLEIQAATQRQLEQQQRMMQSLAETNEKYVEKYQLTEEQLAYLEQTTANLQVIPAIKRSMTQYSPTGQVIREPEFGDVVAQAYEMAMAQDPKLREIRDEITYNARVAAEAARNSSVANKKAKASTLASAPSAAVPAGNNAPSIGPDNKMDLNATSEAIAKALSQMRE